jgi:hypothetical protein
LFFEITSGQVIIRHWDKLWGAADQGGRQSDVFAPICAAYSVAKRHAVTFHLPDFSRIVLS